MSGIYQKEYQIPVYAVDCHNRLKLSQLLQYIQALAGDHSDLLGTDRGALSQKGLFWAVIRHRVQITRLPRAGETVTLETWPLPTTRTAFPRSAVAYDTQGNELFRSISLWVLMDINSRAMVLPGKSGVAVEGLLRGNELSAPGSLTPKALRNCQSRTVRFTDLDWNGHMNNCRYLDWVMDALPSAFHARHTPKEFSICYLSEAWENETLSLHWDLSAEDGLLVDAHRESEDSQSGHCRVFSAKILY